MKDWQLTLSIALLCSAVAVFLTLVLSPVEAMKAPIEANQCNLQTIIFVSGTTSH